MAQRQIDHRGHARGGPYRAVLDEDAILFDTHARVGLPQRVGVLPMGGGPLAVEQAGGGRDESAGASGGHAARRLRGGRHESDHRRADRQPARSAHDQNRVEARLLQRLRLNADAP